MFVKSWEWTQNRCFVSLITCPRCGGSDSDPRLKLIMDPRTSGVYTDRPANCSCCENQHKTHKDIHRSVLRHPWKSTTETGSKHLTHSRLISCLRLKCVLPRTFSNFVLWITVVILLFLPSVSRCQTNIDECMSGPCRNNGTCSDGINGYTCNCTADYIGADCEISVSTQIQHHLFYRYYL